jgi:hypothetical protein
MNLICVLIGKKTEKTRFTSLLIHLVKGCKNKISQGCYKPMTKNSFERGSEIPKQRPKITEGR